MRKTLVVLMTGFAIAVAPAVADAEPVAPNPPSGSAVAKGHGVRPRTSRPVKSAPRAAANPCAQYGAGFYAQPGSTTCIKIGGSVSIGAGFSR